MKRISVLAAAAFLTFSGLAAHAGNGESLLGFVPASTQAMGVVNVESLRGSPLMNDALAAAQADANFASATTRLQQVGFDPAQQVNTVLAAMSTTTDQSARPVILVEATFPRTQIEEAFRSEGTTTVTEVGGLTVFEAPGLGATVFLSDTVLAVGPRAMIEEVITAAATPGNQTNGVINGLVGAADHSRNVWFVAGGIQTAQTQGTPLAEVSGYAASLNIASGLDALIMASTGSAEAATSLSTALQGQVQAAAANDTVAALGLASVLQQIEVSSSGAIARISVALPQGQWQRVMQTLKSVIEEEMQ